MAKKTYQRRKVRPNKFRIDGKIFSVNSYHSTKTKAEKKAKELRGGYRKTKLVRIKKIANPFMFGGVMLKYIVLTKTIPYKRK